MHCNLLCTQGHWLLQTSFHGTAEPTMELVSFTPTNICSPDSSHLPPAREEHREAQFSVSQLCLPLLATALCGHTANPC